MTQQYDPSKVLVTIGGVVAKAFASGSMVVAKFAEDLNSVHVGTDGEGRHVVNKNRSGTFSIKLADYSPTNDAIQLLADLDQPFPIMIVDKTSLAAVAFSDSCKVQTLPDFERGKEATELEWVFSFVKGTIKHSGAKE